MPRDMSVYERELNRQQDRNSRRQTGSGDYQWFSPPKPARKGDKTRVRLRVLPLPAPEGSGEQFADEWWVRADQHVLTVDGKTSVYNCPDDHDRSDGAQTCPLCALRRELYRENTPAAQELAKDLKVRQRAFAVIACPESDNEIGPFVWGFSAKMLNDIMEIAVAKRCMVDDPDVGRDLLLTTNRIGPKRYDIRYSITDMDPSALEEPIRSIVDSVPDLNGLSKAANPEELRELAALLDPRPGGKRATAASQPSPRKTTGFVDESTTSTADDNDVEVEREVSKTFHYSGPNGDKAGLSLEEVAKRVADNDGDHYVWKEGWGEWKPVSDVPEVMEAVKALQPKTVVAPPPPGPPKPPGPPRPPKPPGGSAF